MQRTPITTMHDLASMASGRRIELGLTQAEVAARAGVSRDWVSYFERGKRTVELALVFRLLDALGVGIGAAEAAEPDPSEVSVDDILNDYLNR